MFGFSVGDFKDIISWWHRCKREEENDRKATSVEMSGVLPDGTKFAIKEYAKDSETAYDQADRTLAQMKKDHEK